MIHKTPCPLRVDDYCKYQAGACAETDYQVCFHHLAWLRRRNKVIELPEQRLELLAVGACDESVVERLGI